jgi:serine/threonine-protein kinase
VLESQTGMALELSCLSCGTAVASDVRECPNCGSRIPAPEDQTVLRLMPEQEQTGQVSSPLASVHASEERTGQIESPMALILNAGQEGQERTGTIDSPMALAFAQATSTTSGSASGDKLELRTGQMFSPAALAAQGNENTGNLPATPAEQAELAASAATPLPSNAPPPEVLPPVTDVAVPSERQMTSPELNPIAPTPLPTVLASESAGSLGSSEQTAPTQSHSPRAPLSPPGQKKDPLVGARIGDYLIEGRVGIGAMGIVYRGFQPIIAKHVAIKVLRNDIVATSRDMERLLEEARVVNAIQHRNIISIFGAGELDDGRQYLVMEYLEGETLDARLERETKLSVADALPILEDVLAALEAAHKVGIVHRDLKPANVFLAKQADGKLWVKLLDFGLARKEEKREVSRIAGTPDYIAPEHARGKAPSPASDIYGFGVLAFHLLTGRLPFIGAMPIEVMDQHVFTPAPSPLKFEPTLPMAMVELILRLLQKDPDTRPKVKEIREILRGVGSRLRVETAVTLVDEEVSKTLSVTEKVARLKRPAMPDLEATVTGRGGAPAAKIPVGWALLAVGLLGVGLLGGWLIARAGAKAAVDPAKLTEPAHAPVALPTAVVDAGLPGLLDAGAATMVEPEELKAPVDTWKVRSMVRLEKMKNRLQDPNAKGAWKALQRKVDTAKTPAAQKDADRALIELENRVFGK